MLDSTEERHAIEKESLAVLQKLQEIYCKNVLYGQLAHMLGQPESRDESEGYYDDVDQLVELYEEKTHEYDTLYADKDNTHAARMSYVTQALVRAVNGTDETRNSSLAEADAPSAVSPGQITTLCTILEQSLTPRHVETALVVGALTLAEASKRAAEADTAAAAEQRMQRSELERTTTDAATRRAGMKVSPEEMFRMAQLVRSGLADDAALLQMRNEDEDGGDDVELNEEEPKFLRRAGLPSLRKHINYRSLLPSQLLREARTPQQRQAILDRQAQRQQRDVGQMNSLERTAELQLRINADRRQIARQARRTASTLTADTAAAGSHGGGEGDAAAGSARRQSTGVAQDKVGAEDLDDAHQAKLLLHSELDERPEEGGFGRGELPAKLPPWLLHSVGGKPRFGLPHVSQSLQEQRTSLPIYARRDAILQYVDSHSVTILVGETGSGKTTQIPQYLAEHGYATHGMICCTQPRRVAAETLAMRVAEEYGCRLGEEVGYTVRFRDVTSSLTKIKYVTDGMLLREALLDDGFQRYSVIILDEAHERSINTDLLFAIVRNALRKHPGLKVMVTSATLETNKFCAYFSVERPFLIEGRAFPVETYYLGEPTTDYVRAALQTVMKIHLEEPPGDILVFFTGQEEIEVGGEQLYGWMQALRDQVTTPLPDLLVLPLTATMPQEVQSRVFERTPPGCRKVVLATNVAETSITIDNLYYVIDSGFCKQSIFDPKNGIEQLRIVPVSQAQAKQRAGRAGRIGPGKCFRMYTEVQFTEEMTPETVPDIMRANLFHVTLQLKAMGIDLLHLDLMDRPSTEAVVAALEKLRYLEALDDDGLLTPLGGRMAQLSIDPSQSKTLLTAVDFGCSEPVLTIVSMLAVQRRGVFYRPRDKQEAADAAKRQFAQPEGDQLTLMAVYDAWIEAGMSEEWCQRNFLKYRMLVEARDTRDQLKEMLTRRNRHISHANDTDLTQIRRALTAGYFFNAARRVDSHARSYVVLSDRREVYVHPSSVLIDDPPKYVLFDDLRMTSREYMTELLVIDPKWLVELAPAFYTRPGKGRRLTREQEAERFTPILRAWETGSSWRISRQRRRLK